MKRLISVFAITGILAAAAPAASNAAKQDPPTSGAEQTATGAGKVVGRFTSTGLVVVNGASQKAAGVTWWPVAVGDQVEVREAPTYFRMVDQNRLVLSRDGVAKVNRVDDKHTYVYLKTGEVRFEPVVGRLFICAIGHLYVPATGAEGFVQVGKQNVIRAVDNRNSLVDGGKRSCDEAAPAAWWLTKAGAAAAKGGAAAGEAAGGISGGTTAAILIGTGSAGAGIAYKVITKESGGPEAGNPIPVSNSRP